MRDEGGQTTSNGCTTAAATSTSGTASLGSGKKHGLGSDCGGLFGRGKYKLWALAAITLLAFWSMFTGSVTLKWSAVHLKDSSHDLDFNIHGDFDILDVEEREKMVRQMWNIYSHSRSIRLPKFWREAFGAAYEHLISEIPSVKKDALLEIAKMSFRSRDVYEPPPAQPTNGKSDKKVKGKSQVTKARKLK